MSFEVRRDRFEVMPSDNKASLLEGGNIDQSVLLHSGSCVSTLGVKQLECTVSFVERNVATGQMKSIWAFLTTFYRNRLKGQQRTTKRLGYLFFFYVGLMGLLTAYAYVFRPVETSASIA
jgi:hypothetical protein